MALESTRSRISFEDDHRRDFESIELLGNGAEGPFAIKDLWEPSIFPLQRLPRFETPGWDDELPDLTHGIFRSPLEDFPKNESVLYNLNVFGPDQLEPIDASTKTSSSFSVEENHNSDVDNDLEAGSIWDITSLSAPRDEKGALLSWDSFPNHPVNQRQPNCLSEAGRRGFDAALVFQATRNGLENSGRVSKIEPFIWSLFKLGLGWDSAFFRFNTKERKFEKHARDVRISGISLPALDSLIQEFLECGNHARNIRTFIAAVPNRSNSSSSLTALSRTSFILLYSLEDQLFERFKAGVSLLELQELFRRCGCLMKCLVDVTNRATNAISDVEIASSVFRTCDRYSQRFAWLADILHEVMTSVAKPWLSRVATWIGVRTQYSDLAVERDTTDSKGFTDAKDIPDFVPPEHVDAILESGRTLRLLRRFHPDHSLALKTDSRSSPTSVSFEYATTWDDIDKIQRKALAYETQLQQEILTYSKTREKFEMHSCHEEHASHAHHDNPGSVDNIYNLFDLDAPVAVSGGSSISSHRLYKLLGDSQCLNLSEKLAAESPFGPPLGTSVYLSFAPIISSQTRLINFSFLQLLFNDHKIRDHLQLQWRFQLLGDSMFHSRLSHTLFDPNMHVAERKSGVTRGGLSTGLRVGSRDTWPPASSELRLVLMGMLTECYVDGEKDRHTTRIQDKAADIDLPGNLSFAIRELTDDEMVKCKNANAIEALDFLRLQYDPPPVLEEIICTKSLERYDCLFKHLLRLTRMVSVVQGLVRDLTSRHTDTRSHSAVQRRFCFEASHFIHAISDYAFNVCVSDTWGEFEKYLQKIAQRIDRGDIGGTLELVDSPSKLREHHEDILDQMLFALFLTRKHTQVNRQIEHIFGIILTFAAYSKSIYVQDGDKSGTRHERFFRGLYSDFRKHVEGFVKFLRSLDGGKLTMSRSKRQDPAACGGSQTASIQANGVFEHLLLRVDMKEYY